VGPRGGLGIFEDRKVSFSYRNSSPGPSSYTDYATPFAVPFLMTVVTEHRFHEVACAKYGEVCETGVTYTRMESCVFMSDRFNVCGICM
jgi:hypothetical protein